MLVLFGIKGTENQATSNRICLCFKTFQTRSQSTSRTLALSVIIPVHIPTNLKMQITLNPVLRRPHCNTFSICRVRVVKCLFHLFCVFAHVSALRATSRWNRRYLHWTTAGKNTQFPSSSLFPVQLSTGSLSVTPETSEPLKSYGAEFYLHVHKMILL